MNSAGSRYFNASKSGSALSQVTTALGGFSPVRPPLADPPRNSPVVGSLTALMSSSPLAPPFAFRLGRIPLAQGELVVSSTISSVVHAAGSFLFQNSPAPHAFGGKPRAKTPINRPIRLR